MGQRRALVVLLIDSDPQQTLSSSYFGVDAGETTLSDILIEDGAVEKTILPTEYDNLYVIPADPGLKAIKSGQVQIEGGELRLRSCLKRLAQFQEENRGLYDFDWVLIDCPPSLDRLTMNTLVASDFVLVPVDAGAGGRKALNDTVDYITAAQKWYNPTLKFLGMLVNNINQKTIYDQTTEEAVRALYQNLVFDTVISSLVRIRESAEYRTPIVFCTGSEYRLYAEDYRYLCQEVINRVGEKHGQA